MSHTDRTSKTTTETTHSVQQPTVALNTTSFKITAQRIPVWPIVGPSLVYPPLPVKGGPDLGTGGTKRAK